MTPLIASIIFGFIKGLTVEGGSEEEDFSWNTDLWGPAKEEFMYRAVPLKLVPKLPYGTTAIFFAADHLMDDYKAGYQLDAKQVLARLGDTFFGGLTYETAFRRHGYLAALACHASHNVAVGLGSRLRR